MRPPYPTPKLKKSENDHDPIIENFIIHHYDISNDRAYLLYTKHNLLYYIIFLLDVD